MEIVTKCNILVDAGRHSGTRVKHYDTSREHIHASVDASLAKGDGNILICSLSPNTMDHHVTGAALMNWSPLAKLDPLGVNFRPWDWELLQSAMKNQLVSNQIEISQKNAPFTNGDLRFISVTGIA